MYSHLTENTKKSYGQTVHKPQLFVDTDVVNRASNEVSLANLFDKKKGIFKEIDLEFIYDDKGNKKLSNSYKNTHLPLFQKLSELGVEIIFTWVNVFELTGMVVEKEKNGKIHWMDVAYSSNFVGKKRIEPLKDFFQNVIDGKLSNIKIVPYSSSNSLELKNYREALEVFQNTNDANKDIKLNGYLTRDLGEKALTQHIFRTIGTHKGKKFFISNDASAKYEALTKWESELDDIKKTGPYIISFSDVLYRMGDARLLNNIYWGGEYTPAGRIYFDLMHKDSGKGEDRVNYEKKKKSMGNTVLTDKERQKVDEANDLSRRVWAGILENLTGVKIIEYLRDRPYQRDGNNMLQRS